ncbi:unnamed protein product, partial [Didymodactylos carnosus]
MRPLR